MRRYLIKWLWIICHGVFKGMLFTGSDPPQQVKHRLTHLGWTFSPALSSAGLSHTNCHVYVELHHLCITSSLKILNCVIILNYHITDHKCRPRTAETRPSGEKEIMSRLFLQTNGLSTHLLTAKSQVLVGVFLVHLEWKGWRGCCMYPLFP